jgi:hypothetical protein
MNNTCTFTYFCYIDHEMEVPEQSMINKLVSELPGANRRFISVSKENHECRPVIRQFNRILTFITGFSEHQTLVYIVKVVSSHQALHPKSYRYLLFPPCVVQFSLFQYSCFNHHKKSRADLDRIHHVMDEAKAEITVFEFCTGRHICTRLS